MNKQHKTKHCYECGIADQKRNVCALCTIMYSHLSKVILLDVPTKMFFSIISPTCVT